MKISEIKLINVFAVLPLILVPLIILGIIFFIANEKTHIIKKC